MQLKSIITASFFLLTLSVSAEPLPDDINQWGMVTIGKEDPYFILPPGFARQDTSYKQNGPSYMQFFYKDGKNANNWQEQIVFKAVVGKFDRNGDNPAILKQLLADGIKKNCPSNFYIANEERISEKRIGLTMGCRKLAVDENSGIIGYHMIIEGTDSMFTIAREARVAKYDNSPPISDAELQKWKAHLQRTAICAKNDLCITKSK